MTVAVVDKDKRARPEKYGETKKQKQFMLTETASDLLDKIAASRQITRSEAIEQLIREEALSLGKSNAA
jgi:Ribbon-helix-helix protein, copG family